MELYVGGCGQDKLKVVLDSRKKDLQQKVKESGEKEVADGPRTIKIVSDESWEEKPQEGRKENDPADVYYGEDTLSSRVFRCQVINHFHLLLKKLPESDVPLFLEELFEKNPDVIIICDEVGNGIVPMEKEERLYRELVGRSCQWLAARSRRVVRIVCGCMQVLKNECMDERL